MQSNFSDIIVKTLEEMQNRVHVIRTLNGQREEGEGLFTSAMEIFSLGEGLDWHSGPPIPDKGAYEIQGKIE